MKLKNILEIEFNENSRTKHILFFINNLPCYNDLTTLKFINCKLINFNIDIIATYLCNNKTIKELVINNNTIDTNGINMIGESIKINTTLEILNLSNAFEVNSSCHSLIKNLVHNTSIHTLNISKNYIYNTTYLELNNMLKNNHTLLHLDISDSVFPEFSTFGLHVMIGDSLVINNSLESLKMTFNYLDDDVANSLGIMLKINSSIMKLDLSNNNITHEGYNMILNGVTDNNNIMNIDLTNNMIDNKLINILERNIMNNRYWRYNMDLYKYNKNARANIICVMLCINKLYSDSITNSEHRIIENRVNYIVPYDIWIYICTFIERE